MIPQWLESAKQHHSAGRLDKAEALYRKVLLSRPNHPDALHLLGLLHYQAGRFDAAAEMLRRAASANPTSAECRFNLALALLAQGRWDDAIAALRDALSLRPSYPQAYNSLGTALRAKGQLAEAVDAYRQAVASNPQVAGFWSNLGIALHGQGNPQEAVEAFRRAIALKPDFAEAHNNLGNALWASRRYTEAAQACREAIRLRPDLADAYNNLGNAAKDLGQLDEAIDCYRKAITLEPSSHQVHSSLIYTLYFHQDYDAAAILAEHRAWNDRHAKPLAVHIRPHENDRSPDRRLRIGYVSADFRTHPVGLCFEPLLEQHDHRPFEIICFSNVPRADAVTARMQKHADQWLEIFGQSDQEVAELVRQKQIDILVDLSLHMAHNRMLVFARKPAPVQVTYLGYPGTTGLETMDYRLSDGWIDPPGTEQFHSEKTIRLPRTYLCWRLSGSDEAVGPLPALQTGFVTFGSLNNFCKVTPLVLETWGKLLSVVKDSRLILRCPQGQAADHVCRALERYGVDPRRLDLVGHLSWEQYVSLYQHQDIGLDPFPYPGHTTSCDSMWMGVPVVTLAGQTSVSRAGASLLHAIGLSELIAADPQQYVEMARNLAEDLPRLMQLRATLRGRMQQSALMDAAGLARDVEAAYRQMWRTWCESGQ
jgi:predicted O-linked N-acetylglucosamine transferase (SPINDLY family)